MSSDPSVLTRKQITDIDERALELVAITHGDGSTADVDRLTRNLGRAELIGLAISCAAMVDQDRPVSDLLAWLSDPNDPTEGWAIEELRAAHAAHNRGVRTLHVQRGERIYQRLRKRANRSTEGQTA